MKLTILIEGAPPAPHPGTSKDQAPAAPTIEQKVRDALECIESGHDSVVEWKMINGLYAVLRKRKKTARVKNLLEMIEPTLSRYGLCGTSEELGQ